jgi:hypothetical protein
MTLYARGATGKITATVNPSNATNEEGDWTSNDANIATIDANGILTPISEGEGSITATSAAGSTRKDSCAVTVAKPLATNFESTGNVGVFPDTAGDAAGEICLECKLVAEGNVEYIKVEDGEGDWQELTASTDATMWYNVEAETGLRTFVVKTKREDSRTYIAALD